MSLFTVKKEVVQEVLDFVFNYIAKTRDDLFNKAIEEEMNSFWFPSKTMEAAIKKLEKKAKNSHTYDIPWKAKYRKAEFIAKELQKSLEVSTGDSVQLDSEDASWLRNWQEAKERNNACD